MLSGAPLLSLSSLNSLDRASSAFSKSIQRLSTGYKINEAKDSPSDYSISEKMRSNILGFQRVSRNTQDSISMLQTAEAGASQVTSILQRMRELAVQGSSNTYSSNDRYEIQKEIDALREEVGRISDTTAFNSKKLLNGDANGRFLSNNDRVSATINGLIDSGNYNVSLDVTAGNNQVQKSQIFKLDTAQQGATITGSNASNLATVLDPKNMLPSGTANYTITVSNPNNLLPDDTGVVVDSFFNKNSNYALQTNAATISATESGYMVIEFIEDSDTAAGVGTRFKAKFISSETGKEGDWVEFATANAGTISATYSFGGVNVAFQFNVDTLPADAKVRTGDRVLVAVSDMKNIATPTNLTDNGGGVIVMQRNGSSAFPTLVFTAQNSLTSANNNDGKNDVKYIKMTSVSLSDSGNIDIGSITFGFNESRSAGATGKTLTGVATMEIRSAGNVATDTTRLSQLSNFIDADGNKILETSKEVTVIANGKSTIISLEPNDTIADLRLKLQKALTDKLDMSSGNKYTDNNIISYQEDSSKLNNKAVPGTIVIESPVTDTIGNIAFVADDRVLVALGFSEIQAASSNRTNIKVTNSHTGELKGDITVDGVYVNRAVEGLELAIDPRAGLKADYNAATDKIEFNKNSDIDGRFLNIHLSDERMKTQLGVREGENTTIEIPDLSIKALKLDTINLATIEDAGKAITTIDEASKKVISARSKIGAQITRLNYAYDNTQSVSMNLVKAESTIRDVNVAEETTNYTMQQLMMQTSTSLLAQANQIPKMVLELLR